MRRRSTPYRLHVHHRAQNSLGSHSLEWQNSLFPCSRKTSIFAADALYKYIVYVLLAKTLIFIANQICILLKSAVEGHAYAKFPLRLEPVCWIIRQQYNGFSNNSLWDARTKGAQRFLCKLSCMKYLRAQEWTIKSLILKCLL